MSCTAWPQGSEVFDRVAVQMPYDEQQYMFGDVGMIYIFWCFNCNETSSVMQFG